MSRPGLVVVLHGAGPRLEGLEANARRLAAGLGPATRLLEADAARGVGVVEHALALFGPRPFGYDARTLSRSDYDRRQPPRVVAQVEAFRRDAGADGLLVVVGHSLGAAMAVDVLERLAARGHAVDELLLLDRMFFEWRWGAFLGLFPRIPRLTEHGARAVDHLQEVLVHPSSLPWIERIWVSFPAGGHVPLDPDVAAHAGRYERRWAPRDVGHGAVAAWTEPFEAIVRRRSTPRDSTSRRTAPRT